MNHTYNVSAQFNGMAPVTKTYQAPVQASVNVYVAQHPSCDPYADLADIYPCYWEAVEEASCPQMANFINNGVNGWLVWPWINAMVPLSAMAGNTNVPVSIYGSGFAYNASVAVIDDQENLVPITVTNVHVVNPSHIDAVFSVPTNFTPGDYGVIVIDGSLPDGTGSGSNVVPFTVVPLITPVITGSNTVWWFNGQNPAPSAYPTSVTLTSSGGPSTSWSVSQSDGKVNLSSTTGAQITITSTGTHFSSQNGDISITATANGAQSTPFTMTARTPWKLSFVSRQTFCNSLPETYATELTYDLIDNLSATMSTDINWNESAGTTVCENGSNWCNYAIAVSGGSTNPLTDRLGPPNLNVSPAPNPTPICNGQGSGTTRYRSIPQTIYVGNSNSGGVKAQADTLGYYIDHGQHDSIQIPAQPPN